jgi:hypothetical protein
MRNPHRISGLILENTFLSIVSASSLSIEILIDSSVMVGFIAAVDTDRSSLPFAIRLPLPPDMG